MTQLDWKDQAFDLHKYFLGLTIYKLHRCIIFFDIESKNGDENVWKVGLFLPDYWKCLKNTLSLLDKESLKYLFYDFFHLAKYILAQVFKDFFVDAKMPISSIKIGQYLPNSTHSSKCSTYLNIINIINKYHKYHTLIS